MTYAADVWLRPIVIDSTNNVFRFVENAVVKTITLAAGTYYGHADSTYVATYPSFYLSMAAAITAGAASTYTFAPATPTLSTAQTNRGLTLTSSPVADFTIDFSNVACTMNGNLFGYLNTETAVSVSGVATSKYCLLGAWRNYSLGGINSQASDKRSHQVKNITYSHERPVDRYGIEWNTDTNRPIVYEYVPSGGIFIFSALESEFAATAGLAQYDENNAWEDIWVWLARSDDVIVVHDVGTAWDWLLTTAEVVLLADVGQAQDILATARRSRTTADLYTIDIETQVKPSTGLPGYEH